MKVSLKWLNEYVDVPGDLKAFCDRLDLTGTGVEGVERTGDSFDRIVTARVLEKEPHPDSDHMWVTKVDVGEWNLGEDGKPEPLQVVCGAQNFNAGDHIVTALIGATLPGDFTIKKSKLRGVASCGMNCSERELGLGNDHDGIMILPEDAPIGMPFAEYAGIGDTVLDLEITPNRPDCLSMVGMAREVGAMYRQDVTLPIYELEEDASLPNAADLATVEIADVSRCARYTARIVKDVKIGPSPAWLAERVSAAGMRSINNVVDVTNYIMMLFGQPLHAFDCDSVASEDGLAHIIIRPAVEGEKLVTLDGEERVLTPDTTVIANPDRAIALAGVMGGLDSEITESTTTVLLEAATFSPGHTSRTSRNLGLISEASMRYERGVDDNPIREYADAAAALFAEVCGGRVCPGIIDVYPAPTSPRQLRFRIPRFTQMMGVEIPRTDIVDILERLDCEVEECDKGSGTLSHSTNVTKCLTPCHIEDAATPEDAGHAGGGPARMAVEDAATPEDAGHAGGEPARMAVENTATPEDAGHVGGGPARMAVEDAATSEDVGHAENSSVGAHSVRPAAEGGVGNDAGTLTVTAPTCRPDLEREIDLYEEVLRLWGMDLVPPTLPASPARVGALTGAQLLARKVNRALTAAGLNETTTYSFADPTELEKLCMLSEGLGDPVELINPMNAEQSVMRQSIIPGLLRSVAYNQAHGVKNVQLYEIGVVFAAHEGQKKPKEKQKVAAVLAGAMREAMWNAPAVPFDFFDGKGAVESLARELAIPKLRFKALEADEAPHLQPGRAAQVLSGGSVLGWVGEIHPLAAVAFEAEVPVIAFELDLDALAAAARPARDYVDVPEFPPVSVDLALVVDESVTNERLVQCITSAGGKLLADVRLFDVYRDDARVGAGKKSMAYALTFRASDRTLTGEEVEKAVGKLKKKVAAATGAEIRS